MIGAVEGGGEDGWMEERESFKAAPSLHCTSLLGERRNTNDKGGIQG